MLNSRKKQELKQVIEEKDEFGLGLAQGYCKRLDFTQANRPVIVDYLKALGNEINLSDNYKRINLTTLVYLSRYLSNKKFKDMTKEDIILYLNSLRKNDSADPMHGWVSTYNLYLVILTRFFKWLYYPDMSPRERAKPSCDNISRMKRKEKSIYQPTEMRTKEDDLLFLKYCPSKRDRCYHAISRDSSCRPHEILKLRIKDIMFKLSKQDSERFYKKIIELKSRLAYHTWTKEIEISYYKLQMKKIKRMERDMKNDKTLGKYLEQTKFDKEFVKPFEERTQKFEQSFLIHCA